MARAPVTEGGAARREEPFDGQGGCGDCTPGTTGACSSPARYTDTNVALLGALEQAVPPKR